MAAAGYNEKEWQTRKKRIDPKLQALGWSVLPFDTTLPLQLSGQTGLAVTEYPTANGPADYALMIEGKVLAVIEAKKLTIGPQNALTQAERYSRGLTDSELNFGGFHVPFLYSTNGEIIWFHDIRHPLNRSRKIADFHTPSALLEMQAQDFETDLRSLAIRIEWHERLRPYQIEANKAVEQSIAESKRQMLVAMATGTGKTFTMVNQVYRLMKTGAAKRILFLVDRRALAAQAVRAFASFEPEPGLKFDKIYEVYSQRFKREDFDEEDRYDPKVLPESYLLDPKPGHAFVYVCTIQRMTMNLLGRNAIYNLGDEEIDDGASKLDMPIHAFDLVIADECHRGYTSGELSIWRKVLDHFDAVKIGLTATPASHTTAYFKEIVFRYDYELAVREGYLVDYDVVAVKSDVHLNGIFLNEGEQVGFVDPESGVEKMDLLEDEREFEAEEVESKVTSPISNQKILEELRKYTDEHQQRYGRFPKTLVFAQNDLPHTSHADHLVDLARDVFGQGDAFVQKITGRVDRPLQRIREFRNRRLPGIAVTVDMLSTGVDIPDLEFIVFQRPVKSRILFEQMLGRGTRKGDKYPDKSHFTVFDCFDGTLLEYFRQATAITAEPPTREARSIIEIIEDIWANRDREYNTRCLVKRLQRIDKEMHGDARGEFARFIPDGDMAAFAKNLSRILRENFADTMAILRDPNFQNLLLNYKRRPRVFVVGHETEDDVSSRWLVRGADGKEYKPEDYLQAFVQFVRNNPAHVEAIRILLNRPKDWSTTALSELRDKLKSAPQRFTVENLQKAHELHYSKALADIISMVKHAADDEKPLYTAEERIRIAFAKVTGGQTFTAEQRQWLERIRSHLVANLSVDKDDFEYVPVLQQAGGWGNANKAFEGKLEELLRQFNEAVAA